MKIAIGCDHGALDLKNAIQKHLLSEGYEVIDCGTYTLDSVHYPTYAFDVATKIKDKQVDKGIVCCTSGEGVMICANKVKDVRCGMGYNDDVTRLSVEHNNANCIAFGAKYMDIEDCIRRTDIFLNAEFLGGRHKLRVDMISDYEKHNCK